MINSHNRKLYSSETERATATFITMDKSQNTGPKKKVEKKVSKVKNI